MKLNKKVEKIRDDLYVKKGLGNTYKVVYPKKDIDGNPIPGNTKRLIIADLMDTLPTLIIVGVLLVMLLPGAINIKEECETALNNCINDSCEICTNQKLADNPYNINIAHTEVDNNGVG